MLLCIKPVTRKTVICLHFFAYDLASLTLKRCQISPSLWGTKLTAQCLSVLSSSCLSFLFFPILSHCFLPSFVDPELPYLIGFCLLIRIGRDYKGKVWGFHLNDKFGSSHFYHFNLVFGLRTLKKYLCFLKMMWFCWPFQAMKPWLLQAFFNVCWANSRLVWESAPQSLRP